MLATVSGVAIVAVALAGPALAQDGATSADPASPGRQLYEVRCQLCHGEDGAGARSAFPALSGNERLADVGTIVGAIRIGGAVMPPFPDLPAEQIASLASYLRNAWENDFGEVTTEQVTVLLEDAQPPSPTGSIWDGVFTEAQAQRGREVYPGPCGWCHGSRLNGAPDDPDMRSTPPLARAKFLRGWETRSLATLYAYVRAAMPENAPGSLTDQEYVDVIAYMLSVSGVPAGGEELPPDPQRLARVRIEQRQ